MVEYIERDAALDIVNGWRNQLIPTYGKNDEYVKCLEEVAEHLESLHAAEVRPMVRGKWRKIGKNSCIFVCSACDKTFPYKTSFCPNCGADMMVES